MKTKNSKSTAPTQTITLTKLTGLICVLFFTNSFNVLSQASVANSTNTVTSGSFLGSGAISNFDVTFKRNNVFAGLLATTSTAFGLNSKAVVNSTSIGVGAGQFSSGTVGGNTFIGQNSGSGTSASVLNTGTYNTFCGYVAGYVNTTGSFNTYLGAFSGQGNTSGSSNIMIGNTSGPFNSSNNICIGDGAGNDSVGSTNVLIGNGAGFENTNSNQNTIVGHFSGWYSNGSRNVFLGFGSGYGVQGNDKLDY